ncbi:MAG: HD domain-containing phosphohydrolase [Candidatus Sumerlaeia bacterium]
MSIATVKTNWKGSILIVDDDPAVCGLLVDMLACEGYECEGVGSSGEALARLARQPWDLVITDMCLQESTLSGMELIDIVGRRDDTIPVMMVTAFPSINHAVDAMRRGAVDFLGKPFDREILVHQVKKALQERRLRIENKRLQAEMNKAAVIEKLNRELNRKIYELTRLYAISEGLNDLLDTNALFDRIASLSRDVTGAQRISLMVLDRTRRFLHIRAAIGLPKDVVHGTIVPVGEGIAGQVVQSGKAVRITEQIPESASDSPDDPRYRTRSWMSMPLRVGQEIFGVINLTDKLDGVNFTREDEQILQTLVEKAGIKLENQALYEGIYSNLIDTLNSLITTIEAKDPYTREHSQRVTDYAVALGKLLDLSDDEIEMLNFAGILHDIGKIGVRDEILTKPGRLTSEEYDMIKEHPNIGERIVAPLGLVSQERAIIHYHHERYDGTGYPEGLFGEQIPILARIVAIADAFDAMTTTRSYRKALPVSHALEEMRRCAGSQFDPRLVTIWCNGIERNLIQMPGFLNREAGLAG